MAKSILNEKQRLFIYLFAKKKSLRDKFYLTGGTALGTFYIPYRYSEDLDFFSENEIDLSAVAVFIKSVKEKLNYEKFDINSSFNRNIIQLLFDGEVLKTEFTYFPFPPIENPKKKMDINVDSLIDIAVNKLFTIYQKPRSRDYMDLYMIIKREGWFIEDLVKKARAKFDWNVDLLKLGTQFLKVKEVKDYPRLLVKLDEKTWQDFFIKEAKKLDKNILE